MKVIILAGGLGTRLSEETKIIPKPLVEIGGYPIIWHIMKICTYYDCSEFIICCGYKGELIKKYFLDYYYFNKDIQIDFENDTYQNMSSKKKEFKKIILIDTGKKTMTGGRIKRIEDYIDDEQFLLVYADGVSDINIRELIKYHNQNRKMVTMAIVKKVERFGIVNLNEDGQVCSFSEKKDNINQWINAGIMVVNKNIFSYIKDDNTVFESEVLNKLAVTGELSTFKHLGFWKCMDTKKEKDILNNLWNNNCAPWKKW